jgi:single-strand DNA-binding protein
VKTLNKVFLVGSVGRDPEIKSTGGGTLVANFSLATSRRYKDSNEEWREQTEWHNLVAWGRTAEVVRDYVKKGNPLHIEGRLQTRSWEKDGHKNYRTEIVIDNLIMLGGKRDGETSSSYSRRSGPAPQDDVSGEIEDKDIPF